MNKFNELFPNSPKNPLGIFALFIALIYGMASWVLGNSGTLTPSQQWVFVIFLVVFPIFVLLSFVWLIIRYHHKLYGPGDFRDDSSFLRTLTPIEQKYKRFADLDSDNLENDSKDNSSKKSIETYHNLSNQKLMVLEDLALREVEAELNNPIRRQVEIKSQTDAIYVDGAIINPYGLIVVEVKYIFKINLLDNYIPKFIEQVKKIGLELKQSRNYGSFNIILVILYDSKLIDENSIIDKLKQIIPKIPGIFIDFRIFEESYLKRKYLLIEEKTNPLT